MEKGKFAGLVEAFAKVGLLLQILVAPIRNGRGMLNIFQMDIRANRKGAFRSELFRIYPGRENVIIQVRDSDLKHKQLVLMVKEPVTTFEDSAKITKWNKEESIMQTIRANRRSKFSRKVGDTIYFTMKTDEAVRYFLVGVDERQLFIAQLTGPATTVKEARRLLGKSVEFAEGKRNNSVDRQGEWFFLETSPEIRDIIDARIRKNEGILKRKANIGEVFKRRSGNPHTVDELIILRSSALTRDTKLVRMPGVRIFIRGAVRHKDHKTIKFNYWREVIANNEGGNLGTGQRGPDGIFWVD